MHAEREHIHRIPQASMIIKIGLDLPLVDAKVQLATVGLGVRHSTVGVESQMKASPGSRVILTEDVPRHIGCGTIRINPRRDGKWIRSQFQRRRVRHANDRLLSVKPSRRSLRSRRTDQLELHSCGFGLGSVPRDVFHPVLERPVSNHLWFSGVQGPRQHEQGHKSDEWAQQHGDTPV